MSRLAVIEPQDQSIPAQLETAKRKLSEATSDKERIEIRNYAREVKATAIPQRKDIKVQAANLEQDAERAIAKANPPISSKEIAKRNFNHMDRPHEFALPPLPSSLTRRQLSYIRQAHSLLTDEEFEEKKVEALETNTPLTRRALLQEYARLKLEQQRQEELKRSERIPPEKRLNDLRGQLWLPLTRSVYVDGIARPSEELGWDKVDKGLQGSIVVMSKATPRDPRKKQHPATFSEEDAGRLVRLFTKKGQSVVDPFIGTGSTAIACAVEERTCTGFDLYEQWVQLANERVNEVYSPYPIQIEAKDALLAMRQMDTESQDFILTSPPYWGILLKTDHKAIRERASDGLATDYGDNEEYDLGRINSYEGFLDALTEHFKEWIRVLKHRAYAAVIVSDFRHQRRYYPFHAHIGERLEKVGMTLQGMVIIVQDSKRLYPYGYPTTYVPNICNQFVVIARKI